VKNDAPQQVIAMQSEEGCKAKKKQQQRQWQGANAKQK
jgi:hypothetical protein